jgi:hypothetical protein
MSLALEPAEDAADHRDGDLDAFTFQDRGELVFAPARIRLAQGKHAGLKL